MNTSDRELRTPPITASYSRSMQQLIPTPAEAQTINNARTKILCEKYYVQYIVTSALKDIENKATLIYDININKYLIKLN